MGVHASTLCYEQLRQSSRLPSKEAEDSLNSQAFPSDRSQGQRSKTRENRGLDICSAVLSLGAKVCFPLSSSSKHTHCLKRLPSSGSGKRLNPLLGCVISSLTFLWWWQEISWLSLYISSGIRLLTCVHPSFGGSTSSQMVFFPVQAQHPLPF